MDAKSATLAVSLGAALLGGASAGITKVRVPPGFGASPAEIGIDAAISMARQVASKTTPLSRHTGESRCPFQPWVAAFAGMTLIASAFFALPAIAGEEPKGGGTLTYMIPADAPPSFDGHRESTYATVHSVAPFYSVLIRVDPDNPADITHFVCDLCTEIPQPMDDGKSYTF